MRVVAGEAKGRRLESPPGDVTRPTIDRVREALFNALGSLGAVEDAVVLDLFAGSGALGIEALSRGAARAVFVERSAAARRVLDANLVATGLDDRAEVIPGSAEQFLVRSALDDSSPRFDLVLLDPPYDTGAAEWTELLGGVAVVAPQGVAAIESDRAVGLPGPWHVLREKWYGSTLLVIASPTPPEIS